MFSEQRQREIKHSIALCKNLKSCPGAKTDSECTHTRGRTVGGPSSLTTRRAFWQPELTKDGAVSEGCDRASVGISKPCLSLLSSWTTWAPNPRILWFYQNCFRDNSCHYLSLESCGLQDLFKIILGVWGPGFDSVVHLSWQVTSGFSRNKEAFHGIETLSILCVNSTVRRTHIFRNWDIHISNMPQYIGYSIEAGFLIWCQ